MNNIGGLLKRPAIWTRHTLRVGLIVGWLAQTLAWAGIIAADGFNQYASGTALAGQGGAVYSWWASEWVVAPPSSVSANVTNVSISFRPAGGSTVGGGNSVSIGGSGTGILVSRQLFYPQTGTFYAGMLVKWNGGALNSGDSLALFLTDNETNVVGGFNFGLYGIWSTYGTCVRVGTGTPVAGAYKSLPSQMGTYYMVVKVEKTGGGNYNRITGWINPGSTSESLYPDGNIQLLADSGISNITTVVLRAGGFDWSAPNGPDYTLVDGLTLATTFAELMAPAGNPPPDSSRPFIWVREGERSGILGRIVSHAWANGIFNGMINRVAADVASHQTNRDSWLRQLPVNWTVSPALFKTIPVYAESVVRGPAESKFNDALDCAVLYYLTRDSKYAQCAADVLHNALKTLLPVAPSTSLGNGGWVFQSDLLKEARVIGTQLPIVYDLLYQFLQTNQVYDVQTAGMVNFSFTEAQNVFRTYYQLCRDHGGTDSNWSSLMATCMLNSLLALDSATERAASLEVYLYTGGSRQDSLDHDYKLCYTSPDEIWHEPLQYSGAVGSIRTFHMVLLERYDPTLNLFGAYPNLPLSLPRISQLRYPNVGMQISFGDGHRDAGGQPCFSYELVYQHALARGRTNLTSLFGGLLNGAISAGEYNRSTLQGYESLSAHNQPLQLLWFAPAITEPAVSLAYPRTDQLSWAGIALQRNPSTANNATYGLMGFVGGAAHVHSHASGMSMELFGLGQVMGAKAGTEAYGSAIHENYYRLFSANNTVVVNGASRGQGGWSDIAINTVQTVAMEPQPFAAAVSSNFSFSCSSFADNKGSLAEATQQRTLSIVRTSPTTGFYVDIFRSKSTVLNRVAITLAGNVTNQFHDYIYHNIGSTNISVKTNGITLPLFSQPGRFQNDIGDTYAQPGWRYLTDTAVSYPHSQPVWAQFSARPSGTTLYMEMIMPGVATREYARVTAPPIVDYSSADSPALVVRQIGDAWDKPFAVVYEPHFSATGASVTNVTALWRSNIVAGLKIESVVGGRSWVHYVLSNPNPNETCQDSSLGLRFSGRFGIIAESGDGSTALYLGDGKELSYRGNSVAVVGGTNSQAEVQFTPGQSPTITANAQVNVISARVPEFTAISILGGIVSLQATGSNGVPYRLWSTTNLAGGTWTLSGSGTVTNSPFVLEDATAVGQPTGYYRFTTP